MSQHEYHPVDSRPAKSGSGSWAGVIILAVIFVALIVFGVTVKLGHHSKATTTTTATTLLPGDSATTTTAATDASAALKPVEAALPPTVPTALTTATTKGATWRATNHGSNGGGAPTPTDCVTSPLTSGDAQETFELSSGGATVGRATISYDQFASASEAGAWASAHSGSTFLSCALTKSRGRLTAGSLGSGAAGSVTESTDGNAAIPSLTNGVTGAHYAATATVGGKSCQYYEDSYWQASGRYGVTASFITCGSPFPPQVMQQALSDAVTGAGNLT